MKDTPLTACILELLFLITESEVKDLQESLDQVSVYLDEEDNSREYITQRNVWRAIAEEFKFRVRVGLPHEKA